MSLLPVEAVLPVIVVLSIVVLPKVAMPPPTPTVNVSTVPFWPAVTWPTDTERAASQAGFDRSRVARRACTGIKGLVGRDGIGGLGLLGSFLGTLPGVDCEGAGDVDEDPATLADPAFAAVAAVATLGVTAGATGNTVASVAAFRSREHWRRCRRCRREPGSW